MEEEKDTKERTKERTKDPTKERTNNSHEEYVREEGLLETEEEEGQGENEETTGAEENAQGKSKEPAEEEVKKWIKDNPFECEVKGCKEGKGGRPWRCKKMGAMNFHKWNSHGISSKKDKEGKEKKKAEPKGEDIMEDIVKRTEAADLRGKLTVAIKRITRLGPNDREALEPELAMVKSWKQQSLKKDITDEELNYIESELISIILPVIKDSEEEAKKDKKKTVEKATKKTEDDDDDDLLGYADLKQQLKMTRMRGAIRKEREDDDEARRRREREEQRRDEEHQKRMQESRGGGGFFDGGNPMGTTFIEEIVPEYDEEGNMIRDPSGKPRARVVRKIPSNPNAIVQSQGRGGDGGDNLLKTLETYHKLTKGDGDRKEDTIKELREERKQFMDKITSLVSDGRDKQIYDNMGKLAGAIGEIDKKIEDDPIKQMLDFEDKLKEHNISRSETTPEIEQIRLESEREKTRRSTDLMMMNKVFKMADNVVNKVTDGPLAKAMAKKIEQSDVIAEEEELPEDEELEADIEEEVAPQQEEQPPPKKPTRKIRGKTKKKRE